MALLNHGGGIRRAAEQYGIAVEDWVDLSTGLNPWHWPIPTVPDACWHRLPEEEDGLLLAAQAFYAERPLLAVSGSQVAIQSLPYLRPRGRVGYFHPAYAEHAWNWRQAGHEMVELQVDGIDDALIDSLDVMLVVNPNNPDGRLLEPEQLLHWLVRLRARGGWLIVDEAFMDVTPQHSLLDAVGAEGLIVLRSLGKFFGLAGIRVGFVFAWPALLEQLHQQLGPWHLNHPARWIATQALTDQQWQSQTRDHLLQQGERLRQLIEDAGLETPGGTTLFRYVPHVQALTIHQQLAAQGILTRYFETPAAIRFGLPADESAWQRLQLALSRLSLSAQE